MMLVRIALIIHDNGAIVCILFIVRKRIRGSHGRCLIPRQAGRLAGIGGVRRSVLIWWEGKVLLTFIMVKIYRRVMFCYASTWPRSMWLVLGRIKLRRDPWEWWEQWPINGNIVGGCCYYFTRKTQLLLLLLLLLLVELNSGACCICLWAELRRNEISRLRGDNNNGWYGFGKSK